MDKFKKILESNSAMSKTSEFKKTDGYKKLRDLCLKIEEGTIDCFYIYVNGFVSGIPLVEVLVEYKQPHNESYGELYLNFLKNDDSVADPISDLLENNYSNPKEILENVVYTTEDLDRLIFKFNSRIVLDKDDNFFEDILLMDTNTKVEFVDVFKYLIDREEFISYESDGIFEKGFFDETSIVYYDKVKLIPSNKYVMGCYLIRYDISEYSNISEYYVSEGTLDLGYIETINNIIKQLKKRLPGTKIFVNKKKEEFIDILVVYL